MRMVAGKKKKEKKKSLMGFLLEDGIGIVVEKE